jgi:hypothetical protein
VDQFDLQPIIAFHRRSAVPRQVQLAKLPSILESRVPWARLFYFVRLKATHQHRQCMRIVSPFFGRNVIEKNGVTWESGGSDNE